MTKLMLATADTEFEQQVRTAFKGRFDGEGGLTRVRPRTTRGG